MIQHNRCPQPKQPSNDDTGFRPNVAIIIANHSADKVMYFRRKGSDAWQYPQGGVDPHEDEDQAMWRELKRRNWPSARGCQAGGQVGTHL